MKRKLIQAITIVLVACLVADPVTASGFATYRSGQSSTPAAGDLCQEFNQEALMLALRSAVFLGSPHMGSAAPLVPQLAGALHRSSAATIFINPLIGINGTDLLFFAAAVLAALTLKRLWPSPTKQIPKPGINRGRRRWLRVGVGGSIASVLIARAGWILWRVYHPFRVEAKSLRQAIRDAEKRFAHGDAKAKKEALSQLNAAIWRARNVLTNPNNSEILNKADQQEEALSSEPVPFYLARLSRNRKQLSTAAVQKFDLEREDKTHKYQELVDVGELNYYLIQACEMVADWSLSISQSLDRKTLTVEWLAAKNLLHRYPFAQFYDEESKTWVAALDPLSRTSPPLLGFTPTLEELQKLNSIKEHIDRDAARTKRQFIDDFQQRVPKLSPTPSDRRPVSQKQPRVLFRSGEILTSGDYPRTNRRGFFFQLAGRRQDNNSLEPIVAMAVIGQKGESQPPSEPAMTLKQQIEVMIQVRQGKPSDVQALSSTIQTRWQSVQEIISKIHPADPIWQKIQKKLERQALAFQELLASLDPKQISRRPRWSDWDTVQFLADLDSVSGFLEPAGAGEGESLEQRLVQNRIVAFRQFCTADFLNTINAQTAARTIAKGSPRTLTDRLLGLEAAPTSHRSVAAHNLKQLQTIPGFWPDSIQAQILQSNPKAQAEKLAELLYVTGLFDLDTSTELCAPSETTDPFNKALARRHLVASWLAARYVLPIAAEQLLERHLGPTKDQREARQIPVRARQQIQAEWLKGIREVFQQNRAIELLVDTEIGSTMNWVSISEEEASTVAWWIFKDADRIVYENSSWGLAPTLRRRAEPGPAVPPSQIPMALEPEEFRPQKTRQPHPDLDLLMQTEYIAWLSKALGVDPSRVVEERLSDIGGTVDDEFSLATVLKVFKDYLSSDQLEIWETRGPYSTPLQIRVVVKGVKGYFLNPEGKGWYFWEKPLPAGFLAKFSSGQPITVSVDSLINRVGLQTVKNYMIRIKVPDEFKEAFAQSMLVFYPTTVSNILTRLKNRNIIAELLDPDGVPLPNDHVIRAGEEVKLKVIYFPRKGAGLGRGTFLDRLYQKGVDTRHWGWIALALALAPFLEPALLLFLEEDYLEAHQEVRVLGIPEPVPIEDLVNPDTQRFLYDVLFRPTRWVRTASLGSLLLALPAWLLWYPFSAFFHLMYHFGMAINLLWNSGNGINRLRWAAALARPGEKVPAKAQFKPIEITPSLESQKNEAASEDLRALLEQSWEEDPTPQKALDVITEVRKQLALSKVEGSTENLSERSRELGEVVKKYYPMFDRAEDLREYPVLAEMNEAARAALKEQLSVQLTLAHLFIEQYRDTSGDGGHRAMVLGRALASINGALRTLMLQSRELGWNDVRRAQDQIREQFKVGDVLIKSDYAVDLPPTELPEFMTRPRERKIHDWYAVGEGEKKYKKKRKIQPLSDAGAYVRSFMHEAQSHATRAILFLDYEGDVLDARTQLRASMFDQDVQRARNEIEKALAKTKVARLPALVKRVRWKLGKALKFLDKKQWGRVEPELTAVFKEWQQAENRELKMRLWALRQFQKEFKQFEKQLRWAGEIRDLYTALSSAKLLTQDYLRQAGRLQYILSSPPTSEKQLVKESATAYRLAYDLFRSACRQVEFVESTQRLLKRAPGAKEATGPRDKAMTDLIALAGHALLSENLAQVAKDTQPLLRQAAAPGAATPAEPSTALGRAGVARFVLEAVKTSAQYLGDADQYSKSVALRRNYYSQLIPRLLGNLDKLELADTPEGVQARLPALRHALAFAWPKPPEKPTETSPQSGPGSDSAQPTAERQPVQKELFPPSTQSGPSQEPGTPAGQVNPPSPQTTPPAKPADTRTPEADKAKPKSIPLTVLAAGIWAGLFWLGYHSSGWSLPAIISAAMGLGAVADLGFLLLAPFNPWRFQIIEEFRVRGPPIMGWRERLRLAANVNGKIVSANYLILRGLPRFIQRIYLIREQLFLQRHWVSDVLKHFFVDPLLFLQAIPAHLLLTFFEHAIQRTEEERDTDPLTGLMSRRGFDRQLMEEFGRVSEGIIPHLSVIALDIKKFKTVNDREGHDVGDKVLREVSKRLREGLSRIFRRSSDYVTQGRTQPRTTVPERRSAWTAARPGGDEFVVLLPGIDLAGAKQVADQLRKAVDTTLQGVLSEYGLQLKEGVLDHPITVSLGVATFERKDKTPEPMLKRADQALYLDKGSGGSPRVAAPATPTSSDDRPGGASIHAAIELQGQIVEQIGKGLEVLATRWRGRQLALLSIGVGLWTPEASLIRYLSSRGIKVQGFGIDTSQTFLERVRADMLPILASEERLPVPDGQMDAAVLLRINDRSKLRHALAEVHRVLRPFGYVYVLIQTDPRHRYRHDPADKLGEALTRAGFINAAQIPLTDQPNLVLMRAIRLPDQDLPQRPTIGGILSQWLQRLKETFRPGTPIKRAAIAARSVLRAA
jgi:GGDEF domain-containing protein